MVYHRRLSLSKSSSIINTLHNNTQHSCTLNIYTYSLLPFYTCNCDVPPPTSLSTSAHTDTARAILPGSRTPTSTSTLTAAKSSTHHQTVPQNNTQTLAHTYHAANGCQATSLTTRNFFLAHASVTIYPQCPHSAPLPTIPTCLVRAYRYPSLEEISNGLRVPGPTVKDPQTYLTRQHKHTRRVQSRYATSHAEYARL